MKSLFKYSLILITSAFIATTACEDLDLDNDEAGSVQGFWELRQSVNSITYLQISDTEVIFYFYDAVENCIKVDAYQVLRIDGTGFYILDQEGLEENRVLAISKNGDRIHVRDIEKTQSELDKYSPSEVDINTLAPICVDPTDVFGNWELELEDGDHIYISVREDSIKIYDQVQQENCFFFSGLEVIEINGNVFTITDNDPASTTGTQEVTLTRTNQGLEIERREDEQVVNELFVQSDADFSTFGPICSFDFQFLEENTWQYNAKVEEGDIEFYLTIDQEYFTFHFRIGDPINAPDDVCFDIQKLEIISRGDGTLTVREPVEPFGEIEFLIEFREEEGLLYVDDTLDILTFFPTNIDSGYINNQCSFSVIPATKIF
ncbi:MAG: hypothetical protein JJ971_01600 [Balneolaceae bacterium]|nr:hypothetical protein [Balneolaceae bacterium]MBO6545067.1 hypothetical protein [Balneolaceae bacterium]MBO6646463.1 hypothetical protein [Balneolaceae bacterium]